MKQPPVYRPLAGIAALLLSTALTARAEVPAVCEAPREVDKYQLLRRLSLDLRGQIPTYEEYVALEGQPGVPTETIRAFLASPGFGTQMRRYHEELFWPNVSNVSLGGVNANLVQLAKPAALAIASVGKRRQFRGLPDVQTATLGAQCGDFEQTQFQAGGGFVPAPAGIRTSVIDGVTVKQEGWRLVRPYWAPDTQVKVCAFDAMETESVVVAAKTIACNTPEGDARPECGCGPGLRFCYGPAAQVRNVITAALREQLLREVDRVSTGGQPYTDLLTRGGTSANGPVLFWKKYLAPHLTVGLVYARPDPDEPLPDTAFTDASWREVARPSPLHAGVLTSAAYLLRFQTDRGRANRFRIDFECESFIPPSQIETPAQGCTESGTDLTRRCTCRYCHRALEPLAAHWGQFAEAGTTVMSDPALFPRVRANCVNAKDPFCRRFYVTNDEADKPGSLLPYQYVDDAHPGMADAIAAGPKRRVAQIVADGTLARCTVKRLWQYLMKRDMKVSGDSMEELPLLQSLSDGFAQHGYALPWLVEQLVSQPAYRRAR